jgi:hypothetical protein
MLTACTDADPTQSVPSAADLATPGPSANPPTAQGDDGGARQGSASSASANPSPNPTGSQRERAEAFYGCLVDASLPAQISEADGDQATVTFEDVWTWRVDADGVAVVALGGVSRLVSETGWVFAGSDAFSRDHPAAGAPPDIEAERARLTDDAKASPWGYVMYIDGADRTEEYATCLETSGYTEPGPPPVDQEALLAQKQRSAAASNEWAACAREHGFPDIRDAVAERDTYPVVLLPPTITAELLATLLSHCPVFDPEIEKANLEADRAGRIDEVRSQPVVGFDAPGFREQEDDGAPASPEAGAKFSALSAQLWAAQDAFYRSLDLTPVPVE